MKRLPVLIIVYLFVLPVYSQGNVIDVNTRTQLAEALNSAKAGDTIRIAPGTYAGGISKHELQGQAGKPITITGSDPGNPPVFKGGHNAFQFTDPAYVILSHLVVTDSTANGINIDDAGSFDTPAQHVTLKHIQFRNIGPRGNRDALKLSGVKNFTVSHCTFSRWGSSGSAVDMVGCHDGQILYSTFTYESDLAANGVQAKGGSTNITIQYCRFVNAGSRAVNVGGSTGLQYFRPKPQGYEAKNIKVLDCTFIGSLSPIAFVGVDGATVAHNTIYLPQRWVIRILQETKGENFVPCRNGVFSNNIIAYKTEQVRTYVNVGGGTAPETFKFKHNHWYAINNPARSKPNLPTAEANSTYGKDPQFINPDDLNLKLKPSSLVKNAGAREVEKSSRGAKAGQE